MSLIKISDGFDFTPYLAIKGYEIVEDVPVEKSSKLQSTGFNSKVFGTYGKTVIKLKFVAGMTNAAVAACLAALKAITPKGLFEYWSPQKSAMRKAYFFIDLAPVNLLLTAGANAYTPWEVTLEQADVASDIVSVTVPKYGTAVDSSDGTWVNPNNIKAADTSWTTTAGSLNADWDLVVSGFGFAIPAGSVINSVSIEMVYKLSTAASSSTISMFAAYKGTKRGTAWTSTAKPTADTWVYTFGCGTWTVDQLNSADAQIYIRVRRTSSTACTFSFNYALMSVTYTEVG